MHKPFSQHHSLQKHFDIIRGIWKREFNVFGLERYIALMLAVVKLLFPMRWISHYTKHLGYGARNRALEVYMISKFLILCLLLSGIMPGYIAIPLVIYILADITQYLLGLIFLSNVYTKLPVIKRNFAHLMMNVGEIVMGFGVLYLYFHAVGTNGVAITSGIDAAYFSMVTFSTIGYGDIIPLTQMGRILVIIETLVSLLFVTIIVSSFVAGMDIKDEA